MKTNKILEKIAKETKCI